VVEHLLSKLKALSSNPSTSKKERKGEKKIPHCSWIPEHDVNRTVLERHQCQHVLWQSDMYQCSSKQSHSIKELAKSETGVVLSKKPIPKASLPYADSGRLLRNASNSPRINQTSSLPSTLSKSTIHYLIISSPLNSSHLTSSHLILSLA
jgi:hypothetical protein